jgi:polysaccharide deacetylase 2 family uncharacterized protein YibQ
LVKTKGKSRKFSLIIILFIVLIAVLLLKKQPGRKKEEMPSSVERIFEEDKPEIREKPQYKIAIIIDDVGYPSQNITEYEDFSGKLTFAVLPFLQDSVRYANILHEQGFEILIHIPMEPIKYPEHDPGPIALFTIDNRQEVEKKIDLMIRSTPYAVGANNHMGSKATQDPQLMDWTLTILRQNDLFFIDSITTNGSNAYSLALEKEMKTSRRDIFLDNEDNFHHINNQFNELKKIAKARGTAIGIGHFNREYTLQVLKYQLPKLEEENISLIFASEAVH